MRDPGNIHLYINAHMGLESAYCFSNIMKTSKTM